MPLIKYLSLLFIIVLVSCQSSTDKITSSIVGYDWCYPDCNNPISAFKFNPDGTFNASTKMFGEMSRWGKWESQDDNKIRLITTKISANKSSDELPDPQILTIISNDKIQVGSTTYIKG